MNEDTTPKLSPVSFLQAFVTQSVKVTGQLSCEACAGTRNHIERVGLSASRCLEEVSRRQLGYEGEIGPNEYAELIINIKNQIGGHFAREGSGAGTIRVVASRCPFGEQVKAAPELCRMTTSVFGGIAARNFSYAKVDLRRRIATGDGLCEVLIYLDPLTARDQRGDEYLGDEGRIYSRSASAQVTARVEERIRRAWCPASAESRKRPQAGPKIVAESGAMRAAPGGGRNSGPHPGHRPDHGGYGCGEGGPRPRCTRPEWPLGSAHGHRELWCDPGQPGGVRPVWP